jgi:hypothetical protein
MRHFGGRLSFPQFVVPMTVNTLAILTNLPFCFWYHLPLPGPLIESVYRLILDTDINSPNHIPFTHYVDYPPHQSTSILITRHLTTHGYFSPNIPECFISVDNVAYQKVVVEGIMEVGRYFILYEVKEVGSFPIGHVRTTQLVAPLNSHSSVLLRFLALILMALFPCFFQSSAVSRKPG